MIRWIIKWFIYISVFVYAVNYWLSTKQYIVNYADIERIAKRHAGGSDPSSMLDAIELQLRKKYRGHIIPASETQWILVNSGGWMGHMYVLHASLTEYILFFGTDIDTSGHSGRYWANITDTLISGNFRQWKEGELTHQMFQPGDTIFHEWGEVTGVQWTAGTYMVEYGRGFIPSAMPFALADTLFGTTDIVTLYYTFRIYAKCILNELLQAQPYEMVTNLFK